MTVEATFKHFSGFEQRAVALFDKGHLGTVYIGCALQDKPLQEMDGSTKTLTPPFSQRLLKTAFRALLSFFQL